MKPQERAGQLIDDIDAEIDCGSYDEAVGRILAYRDEVRAEAFREIWLMIQDDFVDNPLDPNDPSGTHQRLKLSNLVYDKIRALKTMGDA